MARKSKKTNTDVVDPTQDVGVADAGVGVNRALARGGIRSRKKTAPQETPIYKMIGDSKVPVSKSLGKVHKARIEAAKNARKDAGFDTAWREAIRYYENDQLAHRDGLDAEASGNRVVGRRRNEEWSETENVVFANTTTMLPVLYAKNPTCEITATRDGDAIAEQLADTLEDYVNSVAALKTGYGLNLKPKARRCVLMALLTNCAYMKIGYTFRDASSDEAIKQLADLSQQWSEAKSAKDIERVEGEIQALEEAIELTMPEGPFLKTPSPFNVYVDPESIENDFSDACWIAERDFMPTAFVNARFLKDVNGRSALVYEPTHIVKIGSSNDDNGIMDEVNRFSLFSKDSTQKHYGYEDGDAFEKAKMTQVWWYWDKTTRRLFLYHDKDFTWPLWVWDDPLRLSRFFPYYRLAFHETPLGGYAKGEVTYYLDQQDAINEINDEERRARQNIKYNMFYNQDIISRDDVEAVVKGPDGTVRGISLGREDASIKLGDVIFSYAPDAYKYAGFFNKQSKIEAINRISSVNNVLSGEQFKTNTTNKAIAQYNDAAQIRVDEKSDLLEDWLGDIFQGLVELTLMYSDATRIGSVVGYDVQQAWRNMEPAEISSTLNMTIVGGSTDKPTSRTKKKEAVELGQVLGQFVNAAPSVVLKMTMKVFERAFDEIVMTDEDWKTVENAISAPQETPPGGAPGVPAAQDQGGDQRQQVEQLINSLPPQAKQKLQELVQKGMRPSQALQTVVQALHSVQGQQQGNAQPA